MDTNRLSATPQIVQLRSPSIEVQEILQEVLFDSGMLASYLAGTFGSAWYVEVPKHLDDLYEEIGGQAVRDVLIKLLDHDTGYEYLWDAVLGKLDRPI